MRPILFLPVALVLSGLGLIAYVEIGSHERHLRACMLRWEGRDVRYDRSVGCQVRDAVGWVPEKSFVVCGGSR